MRMWPNLKTNQKENENDMYPKRFKLFFFYPLEVIYVVFFSYKRLSASLPPPRKIPKKKKKKVLKRPNVNKSLNT